MRFYEKANKYWKEWGDELGFLFYLDEYRFYKFMVIPSIAAITDIKETSLYELKSLSSLSHVAIKRIYSGCNILFEPRKEGGFEYYASYYYPTESYTCHFIFNNAGFRITSTDVALTKYIDNLLKIDGSFKKNLLKNTENRWDGSDRIYLDFFSMLRKGSYVTNFCNVIHGYTLNLINKKLKAAFEVIELEESKEALF
ncbi:MAG: hypothetical protein GXP22_07310 [Gammaproteobacteria bacterium]|nr:hypothetical protein [Gammaproteobacteria bacterium]